MKILLFLLLFSLSAFAQYGNNTWSAKNPDFENLNSGTPDDGTADDFTSWTEGTNSQQVSTPKHSGSYSLKQIRSGGLEQVTTDYSNHPLGTYLFRIWTAGDGTALQTLRIRELNGAPDFVALHNMGTTSTTLTMYDTVFTISSATYDWPRFYIGVSAVGFSYYDDMQVRILLDTLWVFSTGDNADADTVQTLTEALQNRGTHSGGDFKIEAGTYSETVALISPYSFGSMWSTSATDCVKVDAINFKGVSANLFNIWITTPTNDSGINYFYQPIAPTTFIPADLATNVAVNTVIHWSGFDSPDSFYVKVSENADLSSAIVDTVIVDSSFSLSGLSNATQIYWNIGVKNGLNTVYSDTVSFTTAAAVSALTTKRDFGGYTKFKGFK